MFAVCVCNDGVWVLSTHVYTKLAAALAETVRIRATGGEALVVELKPAGGHE